MTALILVTSNDVRKKKEGNKKDEKELTDEEKENYFKCVDLIMGAISDKNKALVLKERDGADKNALMWCCSNGNIQSAEYLLKQCPDDKVKEAIITQKARGKSNAFHESIVGGNIKLTRMIHDVFKEFKKEDELIKENHALQGAFQQGSSEVYCVQSRQSVQF